MSQKQSDFDHWIRNLADEAESPFHEASWLKMEELLDTKKKKRIFWWIWPVGIGSNIVLAGLIYFFIKSYSNSVLINTQIASNTQLPVEKHPNTTEAHTFALYTIKATVLNAFETKIHLKEINEINLTGTDRPSSSTASSNNHIKAKENGKDENENSASQKFDLDKHPGTPTKVRGQRSKLGMKKDEILNKSKAASDKTITLNSPYTPTKKIAETRLTEDTGSNPIDIYSSENVRNLTLAPALAYNWSLVKEDIDQLKMPVIPNNIRKPNRNVYSSFIVSIHASPEITAIPNRSYGSTSKEYGFNLSYQFTPHLSLSTGLQKTNKLYSAKQGDYEIALSDYLYNKVIENIVGICTVVEWPVTVGYKFRAMGNNYFQVNAGLASARMDKESYTVDFSYWKGGRVIRKDYNFSYKNWEMWSSAVFSLSYIKPITKHLSFSLIPYLKTPLKGVGNGNVNLKSVGGQLGINYSIPTSYKN